MSENLSKNDRVFWEDFLDFLNYFLDFRIFPDFNFNFLFLFFDFSAKFSTKKIVSILKISQGQ